MFIIEIQTNYLSVVEAGALLEFLDRVTITGIQEASVYIQLVTKLNQIATSGIEDQGEEEQK